MTQSFTSNPINATSAGGGWDFLLSATAASATEIEFKTLINSTYNTYVFILDQVVSDTDGDAIRIRTSSNAGVSYDSGATDYMYGITGSSTTSSSGATNVYTGAATGTAANETIDGHLFLYNPANANFTTMEGTMTGVNSGSAIIYTKYNGLRKSAAAVDAIQFFGGTDNISGTIKMYGCCKPS
jgi:hypothetical protein